ncbi:Unknown protein, partial [Striga hermonthica]
RRGKLLMLGLPQLEGLLVRLLPRGLGAVAVEVTGLHAVEADSLDETALSWMITTTVTALRKLVLSDGVLTMMVIPATLPLPVVPMGMGLLLTRTRAGRRGGDGLNQLSRRDRSIESLITLKLGGSNNSLIKGKIPLASNMHTEGLIQTVPELVGLLQICVHHVWSKCAHAGELPLVLLNGTSPLGKIPESALHPHAIALRIILLKDQFLHAVPSQNIQLGLPQSPIDDRDIIGEKEVGEGKGENVQGISPKYRNKILLLRMKETRSLGEEVEEGSVWALQIDLMGQKKDLMPMGHLPIWATYNIRHWVHLYNIAK